MKNTQDVFKLSILTKRLILSTPQLSDALMANEAISASFTELHKFMPWAKEKPTFFDTQTFIASTLIIENNLHNHNQITLFIFDRNTSEFIGGTGFNNINWQDKTLEIGYWIKTNRSKQGLATEAANALTRYAMLQLGMQKISIVCDINNIASKNIPIKLGFSLEETIIGNRINVYNQISDTLIFSCTSINNLP